MLRKLARHVLFARGRTIDNYPKISLQVLGVTPYTKGSTIIMSNTKYIVWIKCAFDDEGRRIPKEEHVWEEQGDGPLTARQAERIAREVAHDFGCRTIILPIGRTPVTE